MGFQPPTLDFTAGRLAVVGSGAAAVASLRQLRAAGANVRWFCSDLDVAESVLLASAPPGRLELSFADPLQVDYRDFIAVVAGAGGPLDQAVAACAHASDVPVNVVGEPALSSFALPGANDWVPTRWRRIFSQEIAT